MVDLDSHAARIADSRTVFRDKLRTEKPNAISSLTAIEHALQSLATDFNLDLIDARGQKRSVAIETKKQVKAKRAPRDKTRKCQGLQNRLDDSSGSKVGGRLRKMVVDTRWLEQSFSARSLFE